MHTIHAQTSESRFAWTIKCVMKNGNYFHSVTRIVYASVVVSQFEVVNTCFQSAARISLKLKQQPNL